MKAARLEIDFYRHPESEGVWFCWSPQLPGIEGHGGSRVEALRDWAEDVGVLWGSIGSEADENLAGDALKLKRALRGVFSDG